MVELRKTPENYFVLTCLVLGVLAFLCIGWLVAEPKLLFGRALTAITPALFPKIVLATLSILSLLLAIQIHRSPQDDAIPSGIYGLARGAAFFGLMTVYALTMTPFGFLISTAIAMVSISLLCGNRTIWQIALLSTLAPALLYLAATRLLAVSLPELNIIELFYARLLPW
jgi:putative tricarboxylic transport membrane protein